MEINRLSYHPSKQLDHADLLAKDRQSSVVVGGSRRLCQMVGGCRAGVGDFFSRFCESRPLDYDCSHQHRVVDDGTTCKQVVEDVADMRPSCLWWNCSLFSAPVSALSRWNKESIFSHKHHTLTHPARSNPIPPYLLGLGGTCRR
jgi:hypothetical protein